MLEQKKTILFVSCYFEVLKTFLPYINHLEKKYRIVVLASCLPYGGDKARCQKLLSENKIEHEIWESDNPVDLIKDRYSVEKKKSYPFLRQIQFLLREKKRASAFISKYKPDIIFVGEDTRELERFLINVGRAQSRKSICFQWSM